MPSPERLAQIEEQQRIVLAARERRRGFAAPDQAAPTAAPALIPFRPRRAERATQPADPSARPNVEPGLPSLAAGIGQENGGQTGKAKLLERPSLGDAQKAIDAALDFNPEVSYAAWVYKLLGLKDWRLECLGEDGEPDEQLLADTTAFLPRIAPTYGGGIEAALHVGLDSIMRTGAVVMELDVADSRDDVLEVDLLSPLVVDFEVVRDGNHKTVRPVYSSGNGAAAVPFNEAQLCYIGHAPKLGQPHGQSPFLPVVDTVFPQAALRDGLQRVVKNQGWSRIKFVLDYDKVVKSAPPGVVEHLEGGGVKVTDWGKLKTHIETVRADLEASVEDMYEDDNWVMYNLVSTESVGANHATESFDPAKIAQLFDQDLITSVKGQPAIHGRQWGSDLSSTGSMQWIIQALGIEALRSSPARAVEWAISQWYRISGRRGSCRLVFEPLRKEDIKAEAEARKLEVETGLLLLGAGLIDADEAAMDLVGHPATGTPPAPAQADAGRSSGIGAAGSAPSERGEAEGPEVGSSIDPAGERTTLPCSCGEGEGRRLLPDEDTRVVPFVPADTDVLGPVELAQFAAVDEEDAERVRAAWDRRQRRDAPTFVGMLAAVIVASEDEDRTSMRSVLGIRASDPVAGRWQFDENSARYRYPESRPGRLGRLVPPERTVRLFERGLTDRTGQIEAATDRLLAGKMTAREWQLVMQGVMKDAHLEARMLGVGGKGNMTAVDYGSVGGRLAEQYQALGVLSQDLVSGRLSAAQVRQRALYRMGSIVRETYRRGTERVEIAAGFTEERNILEPGADHCQDCLDETARGYVQTGQIMPIGQRTCRANCACRVVRRRPEPQVGRLARQAPQLIGESA